jgi:DNA-binding Xre family transcriptional regulator
MKIAKYFWSLNPKALKETEKILKSPTHPKFSMRMVSLLSRSDKPAELFSLISKKQFIKAWPKVRAYWAKINRESDFRDWWETIYEQCLQKHGRKQIGHIGNNAQLFIRVGKIIKEKRVEKRLNQKELAALLSMRQPDISNIEKGNKNITVETLARICKVLRIKNIELS